MMITSARGLFTNVLSFDSTLLEGGWNHYGNIYVRDLREHTGDLIHGAEKGKLSLITKHGRPVILAVPFSEDILKFSSLLLLFNYIKKELLQLVRLPNSPVYPRTRDDNNQFILT